MRLEVAQYTVKAVTVGRNIKCLCMSVYQRVKTRQQ